jgi:two-component system sensor kinase FixL
MKKIQSSVHKILQHDFMMVRADDTPVYARMYCIQRVDIATSEMLCYMAILDLTELRIAEREAQQSVRALAHSTRLAKLGEMASALAHEVSQPITALLNYVHILEKKLNTGADIEELKMITEKIAAQANRSSVLSHQIRDYSRLQKSVKSRQSITNIIKESVDLMHANLFEHKVELNLQIQDKLPHVSVDAQQIIQVFVNMISNAIDSIGLTNRYGLIVIRAEMIEKPMRIKISIKDNGAGVSESVKKKLFMPFTSNKEDGLGIGLSLSRSIIEAHGGQVWLDKDYSDGANFYFTLPVGE